MTPQNAHKSGLSLKDALEKYGIGNKLNKKEYSAPNKLPDNWENDPAHLGDAFSNLIDATLEPGRRRYAVQEQFRHQLEKGKLLGIGYLSPRQISDKPQLIPADIWNLGKINFSKSEIASGSLKFENVRIIRLPNNKKIAGNKQQTNYPNQFIEAPNPVGRPSSRDKIIIAYFDLKTSGEIDFSKPMSHAYSKIRKILSAQYKTEKGFQNEAIRLAIREDFEAEAKKLRSAQKL